MKFLLAILGCAILCGPVIAWQEPPPALYEIAGKVLDADTHEAIARVRVNLQWHGSGRNREIAILTDESGAFHVSNVPLGVMSVTYERSGYLPSGGGQLLNVMGPRSVIEFTRFLRKQVVIEGVVANDKGGVLRASVIALRRKAIDGHWEPVRVSSATTDSEGHFRIAGLPPGRYYVAVNPVSTSARTAYPSLFYPDATSLANAELLDLPSGKDQLLDIRVAGQRGFEVQGRIDVDTDSLSCNLVPDMESLRIAQFAAGTCAWDRKSRKFTVPNVAPGAYRLEAGWTADQRSHAATRSITVADRNVDGIVISAAADRILRGSVQQDSPPAEPNWVVRLTASWNGAVANAEPDGTFAFEEIPPGVFRVQVDRSPAQCLQAIHQGWRDALREGVVIADQNSDPLQVVLSNHCGSLEGTIDAPVSNPPAAITVAFFRRASGEMIFESQAGAALSRRQPGTLSFLSRSIAPDDYLVFAWATRDGSIAQLPYATPEFEREYGSLAESVTVRADEKAVVTLHHLLPGSAFEKD